MESNGIDEFALRNELPDSLRIDVSRHQCRALLQNAPLMSHMPQSIQDSIMMKMRPCVIAAGEFLIREGDIGECMFFVEQGKVEVTVKGKCITCLGPGACVGETALLNRECRNASVRATTTCCLYKLSVEDFDQILHYNQGMKEVMRMVSHVRNHHTTCSVIQRTVERVMRAQLENLTQAVKNWRRNIGALQREERSLFGAQGLWPSLPQEDVKGEEKGSEWASKVLPTLPTLAALRRFAGRY